MSEPVNVVASVASGGTVLNLEKLLGLQEHKPFAQYEHAAHPNAKDFRGAIERFQDARDALFDAVSPAVMRMKRAAKIENGVFGAKLDDPAVTDEMYQSAKSELEHIKNCLTKEGEVEPALKKAADAIKEYKSAKTALTEFTNPVFGKIKALGVKGAFEDNLRGFKVWESGAVKGRGIEIAARAVGLGASLFCGTQAAQSKDGDGNAKSGGERMAWLAAAVGIGAAAALAGGVR